MPRFEVVIVDCDGERLPFFTGDLEPMEVGPLMVAVLKRMAVEPPGWTLQVRRAPDVRDDA